MNKNGAKKPEQPKVESAKTVKPAVNTPKQEVKPGKDAAKKK